jgi:flagellar basal body-associated protein FliL
MSTTESTQQVPAAGDPPRARKLTLAVTAAATLAGIAVGGVVVGPRLAAPASAAQEKPAEQAEHGESSDHAEKKMVRVDNLVVNPAGSEGLRFLMVSVAFAVRDPAAETRLRGSDVQIRDLVTGVFERQTMASLTRPGARDSLRISLAEAVKPLIGNAPVRVFLPQFVIQ